MKYVHCGDGNGNGNVKQQSREIPKFRPVWVSESCCKTLTESKRAQNIPEAVCWTTANIQHSNRLPKCCQKSHTIPKHDIIQACFLWALSHQSAWYSVSSATLRKRTGTSYCTRHHTAAVNACPDIQNRGAPSPCSTRRIEAEIWQEAFQSWPLGNAASLSWRLELGLHPGGE